MVNNFIFVIDASGSTQAYTDQINMCFQEKLQTIRENSRKHNIPTYISVFEFSSRHAFREICFKVPCESTISYYHRVHGLTAMYDAVVKSLQTITKYPHSSDEDFVFILITDGIENDSYYSGSQARKAILDCLGTDIWTFSAIGPKSCQPALLSLGFPAGNIELWDGTVRAVENYTIKTQAAISNLYRQKAATGVRKSTSFFETDLSQLNKSDVKNFPDVTDAFKILVVEKESVIKDFYEQKTGKPYITGCCFYELTKKEKIQDYKKVVLMDRSSKRLFQGSDVQKLVGLSGNINGPQAGLVVNVSPGNHSNYRIFVQSMSTNRKLVRGTSLLVLK